MSLSTVGWGSIVLFVGLTARVLAAFGAVSGGRNNIKVRSEHGLQGCVYGRTNISIIFPI